MIINYNNAITSNFRISFPKNQQLEFMAMSVNVPTVSLGTIEQPYQNTRLKLPDNKFEWDDITIEFIMDENLLVYELIKDWISDARQDQPEWQKAIKTINILPLDSNKNIEYSFELQGCFPTNITGWSYTSNSSISEYVTFSVSFAYQHLEIKRIKPLNFRISQNIL